MLAPLDTNNECPHYLSGTFTAGLTAGHRCIRLTTRDGGPNDGDGGRNGQVADPGASATLGAGAMLDIDHDGECLALTDGLLLLRHAFGFEGQTLIQDTLTDRADRRDPAAIASIIEQRAQEMDLDATPGLQALTDGLVMLRYLFGFRGNALVDGVFEPDDPSAITAEARLDRMCER